MSTKPTIVDVDVPAPRPASTFLNYPGDQTKSDLLGKLLGPTYRSRAEYLRVVSVQYDTQTDRTRVGCAYESAVPDFLRQLAGV